MSTVPMPVLPAILNAPAAPPLPPASAAGDQRVPFHFKTYPTTGIVLSTSDKSPMLDGIAGLLAREL